MTGCRILAIQRPFPLSGKGVLSFKDQAEREDVRSNTKTMTTPIRLFVLGVNHGLHRLRSGAAFVFVGEAARCTWAAQVLP